MAYTTINKSSLHKNTTLITGNNSTQAFTGLGFAPDMVWTKKRNGTTNHLMYDKIRGVGYYLYPNLTNAQGGNGTSALTAFGTDGFTLDAGDDANGSGATGVAWSWKAGGAGSANTDGTINSTVSANTTSGFSIITYTGTGSNATVGHGLGVAPLMVIIKKTSGTDDWKVYHHKVGANKSLVLQGTNAETSDSTSFNNTAPTTSVFSVGTSSATNTSGQTYIAYCFAEKTGYSKFGSYTGNGSSSSPTFIYTGFKTKFVIVKNTSQADSWFIHDDKRDGYNDDNEYLFADLSNAEGTNVNRIRLLSNGFNVPTTDKSHNVSGNNYIYMAIGQSLVGSNNIPCTAR